MNFWELNVQHDMKVISDSPDFKLYYLKEGDTSFVEIDANVENLNDSLYLIKFSFSNVGKYLIKLKHLLTDQVHYNSVYVVSHQEFMRINEEYSVAYSGAHLIFDN